MRFYLAGRLCIEGERQLDQSALPGRQGRLALVHLVLERHRPVPSPQLVAAIWGDEPPPSVDTSLRALMSKLRHALAEAGMDAAVIEADAGCYQARLPGAWVDVEVAANAVDRATGAMRSGDPEAALPDATVAAAIARRPLLPGEDAAWVAAARGRLRAVHVRALALLTDVYRGRGDAELAVAIARELIDLEPFREAGHRSLMLAHLSVGDRAEAVRVYERCRALLADELGVDPSTDTEEVYLRALRDG